MTSDELTRGFPNICFLGCETWSQITMGKHSYGFPYERRGGGGGIVNSVFDMFDLPPFCCLFKDFTGDKVR